MDADLTLARDRVHALERARRRLVELRQRCGALQARLDELTEFERRERKDVERLEGLSLQRLFQDLLGTRPEALDKERRELASAELRRGAVAQELAEAEKERLAVLARVKALRDAPDALVAARKAAQAKETSTTDDGDEGDLTISERSRALRLRIRELKDAEIAADRAARRLRAAASSLSSARGWGVADMMGGGFMSTMMKHDNVDDARAYIAMAHSALSVLERELRDIRTLGPLPDLDVDLDELSRFADHVFDGLYVDWMVQKRIVEGLERVQAAVSRVATLQRSLQASERVARRELEALASRGRGDPEA